MRVKCLAQERNTMSPAPGLEPRPLTPESNGLTMRPKCPPAVADSDLELWGGGGGLDLLALSAIFPSVISSFYTQKGGGAGAPRAPPLDPPLP